MGLKRNIEFIQFVFCRWLKNSNEGPSWDIKGTLEEAVISGAQDWFVHIHQVNNESSQTDEEKLQQIIKIVQLVRTDVQRGTEYYDKLFQQ